MLRLWLACSYVHKEILLLWPMLWLSQLLTLAGHIEGNKEMDNYQQATTCWLSKKYAFLITALQKV